ncbi:MAG: hypothetical protein MI923_09125 [Phycisphaerales bacterium]|nr:hypothetical protein [Phycisphaerales bacterium]
MSGALSGENKDLRRSDETPYRNGRNSDVALVDDPFRRFATWPRKKQSFFVRAV